MNELEQILNAVNASRARGGGGVLATVVRVSGSTYRRPGARMWIADDGVAVGAISGGCLERELRRKAAWLASDGSAVVRFDTTSDDEVVSEFGLGCRGVVHVLLERVQPEQAPPYLARLSDWVRRGVGGVAAVVIDAEPAAGVRVGDRVTLQSADELAGAADESPELVGALREAAGCALSESRSLIASLELRGRPTTVFVEFVEPAPRLLICGGNHDVHPVADLAASLGWRVEIVTARQDAGLATLATAAKVICCKPGALGEHVLIDERTFALVMSHNFFDDLANLRALLSSPAAFIGVLGPRSRTSELLEALASDGPRPSTAQLARLHAPIGLDLGAETPQEIALSILAQLQAVRRGRCGRPLSERDGPIHEPAAELGAPAGPTRESGGAAATLQCPLP